jgi:hypothetical protein
LKGYDRLQKVLGPWKEGKLTTQAAQQKLLHGAGHLNKSAFNIAVEVAHCVACAKLKTCINHDCTEYTIPSGKNKGKCTWFVAVQKVAVEK